MQFVPSAETFENLEDKTFRAYYESETAAFKIVATFDMLDEIVSKNLKIKMSDKNA